MKLPLFVHLNSAGVGSGHCENMLKARSRRSILKWSCELFLYLVCLQGAQCGEGLRFRNVSCFVSDGLGTGEGSLVDEELCGDLEQMVDGDKQIILEESCTVPCPGNI